MGREWVRQAQQPFAHQRFDLRLRKLIAQLLQPLRLGTTNDSVFLRVATDAFLVQLPLDILVPVDAELGIVGKVGAKLQEERAEIVVDPIEVDMLHQGGRAYDPRISSAGSLISPLLRQEDAGFLARLANK